MPPDDERAERFFESGCLGKEQFPSESAAIAAAKVYAAAGAVRGKQEPYLCRFADHWHLTGVY
jgi:hypothetical protein